MKRRQILAVAAAVVGVARATVEKPAEKKPKRLVTNERVVGGKEETMTCVVETFDRGIPEINLITQDLRDRFYHGRFGPPPKVLGKSGCPQRLGAQTRAVPRQNVLYG